MGNSEVGHLTIGAGRRLYQDLMRVNKAIEDGSFFENPALRGGVRARPPRAPARARLARRRPLAHRPPAGAAPLRAREDVDPRVHRRPRRLAARRRSHDLASCRRTGSRRSSAATTRWTATSAGSGRSAPSTRSCDGAGTHARRRARGGAGELRRRRHRRVHRADRASRARRGIEPGDTRDLLQLPARPRRGSSPGCCSTHGFDLTTMTRYASDLDSPVVVRGADRPGHARRGALASTGCGSCTSPRPRSTPT